MKQLPNHKMKLLVQGLLVAIGGFCLIILFQNFEQIPLEKLKPDFSRRIASISREDRDMRDLAPERVQAPDNPMFAQPQSGTDLSSIQSDWLTRQSHLITGRAEEQILNDFNKRLNRYFISSSSPDASESLISDSDLGETSTRKFQAEEENNYFGLRPTSVRMMAFNRVQVALKNNARVTCSVEGSSTTWNIAKPLSNRFDIDLQHESGQAKSTMHLNFAW